MYRDLVYCVCSVAWQATNQVALSFPIMVSLMTAKWVGDVFNIGIYDIHIHLKKIPLLEPDMETSAKRFLCKVPPRRSALSEHSLPSNKKLIKIILKKYRNIPCHLFIIERHYLQYCQVRSCTQKAARFRVW